MSAPFAPPAVWPYRGRSPRRCRVIARRRAVPGPLGLVLVPGRFIVAGSHPHLCRPGAAYLVEAVGNAGVQVKVVYSAGGGRMVGRRCWWGRARLEAAWRFGDVRVVARWQAPTETLMESRDRRLDPRGARATGQAAIAAGG